ncbi:MAG: DUF5717 family protein [Eubacteriales bacterium]|nr:DUF5717 family protein [Eubacteriales bacterium]
MRDKINQLADGIFEYRQSEVVTRPEEFVLEVPAGTTCQGSVVISDSRKRIVKGVVTTDSPYITIPEEAFRGTENEVSYQFDAGIFTGEETVTGKLQVISDQGVKQIPFTVKIIAASAEKPVRETWDTIAGIQVKRNKIQIDHCEADWEEEIAIVKDSKGSCEIDITSDAEFAVPMPSRITSRDFKQGKSTVKVMIDPAKMSVGRNFARLRLHTIRQTLEVSITAVKPGTSHDQMLQNRRRQRSLHQMIKRHLDFSMERLPLEDYVREIKKLLKNGGFVSDSIQTRLYRLHLAILECRSDKVDRELEDMAPQMEVLHRDAPVMYAAYYYLKGLWSDEEEVIADCTKRIRESYEQQGHAWQAIWFLLYLDPQMQSVRRKLAAIVEQLETGCNSPVMYLEACQILNEAPVHLKELTPQMGEVLHWGCKKQYVNRELALRYVYLAGRLKQYSPRVMQDLILLYEQFSEDEILTEICKMLMLGQRTSAAAFSWYEKGIARNLKITELYEYYMYSLDESQDIALNSSILLYFSYDNHLTADKKAMLYAYIVREREQDPETYASYRDAMQEFALHQLELGRINRNLAVLYTEFIDADSMDDKIAAGLSDIMFCHRITCENPDMIGVCVKHPELSEEEFVPLRKGSAVVYVITSQARIYMVDGEGRRYAESIAYKDEKLLELDDLAECCLEYRKSDTRLLLYQHDQMEQRGKRDRASMLLRKQIFGLSDLSYRFRQKVFSILLHHYQRQESDMLDDMLDDLDWQLLRPSDRILFIRYCADRQHYDKAMEGVLRYGYEKISAKDLLKISEKVFSEVGAVEDPKMVKLAWHMFWEGIYSNDTLRYLCRFYTGTVEEMVQIWVEAQRADLDTLEFQERLLAQAVFSGEIVPEVFDIFYYYQEKGTNKRLLLAFKKLMAYEYLIKDRQLPVEMFGYYFRDVQIKENTPCLIAVLKYFSTCSKLSEEEANFADYHLIKLYDQKIVFPFYQDFYGKFPLPTHIMDERYVEYIADPAYEVTIHYRILSADGSASKFKVEKMRDVFEGIRVKEFVLFQDEILEYYVIEHHPGEEIKSPVRQVTMVESMDKARASSRYHTLNLMMIAQEMHDDVTLIDLMEEYAKEREMAKEVFKPM